MSTQRSASLFPFPRIRAFLRTLLSSSWKQAVCLFCRAEPGTVTSLSGPGTQSPETDQKEIVFQPLWKTRGHGSKYLLRSSTSWYSVVTMQTKRQAGSLIIWTDAESPARSRPSRAGGSQSHRRHLAQNLNGGQQPQGQSAGPIQGTYREEVKHTRTCFCGHQRP